MKGTFVHVTPFAIFTLYAEVHKYSSHSFYS